MIAALHLDAITVPSSILHEEIQDRQLLVGRVHFGNHLVLREFLGRLVLESSSPEGDTYLYLRGAVLREGGCIQAHKIEATVDSNRTIVLTDVPFVAGERVEIIVLSATTRSFADGHSPLRGTVQRYEAPFEPAAQEDWEAAT